MKNPFVAVALSLALLAGIGCDEHPAPASGGSAPATGAHRQECRQKQRSGPRGPEQHSRHLRNWRDGGNLRHVRTPKAAGCHH